MLKSAVMVQESHRLYLFIGHPRNPIVQHLHSALNHEETLSLTMRPESKLLDPSLNYAVYILDGDHLQNAPQVIRSIRSRNPKARVLLISKAPDWESVREALRAGAMDVLPLPASREATRALLEDIMTRQLPSNCRA